MERSYDTIQKVWANAYAMRRISAGVLLLLLLATSAPFVEATSKGVISCTPADTDMLPANWPLDDGTCVRVDLGILSPGETLSFDIDSDVAIDILLFDANSVTVYQNEQNYRLDSVWQSESVFESFSGNGSWHWTTPSDRDATAWYLVLDNMAHPQDNGSGAQGGSIAAVTLNIETVPSPNFGIVDSIVRLETGTHNIIAGPLSLDYGTIINMFATTMQGAPDIFIMTQAQHDNYVLDGTATTYISGTEMLLILEERSTSWAVTEQYDGQDLYIAVDNHPGPAGGGAGTGFVATTVVISLTPVVNPIITDSESLALVDVGANVILDASNTPNRSDQIEATEFHWDTNGDGVDDTVGVTVSISWDEPTNVSVRLRVISQDGRSATTDQLIEVKDISNPEISLSNSDIIRRDFDDELVLFAAIMDNWGISKVEWLLDDSVIESFGATNWQDGTAFNFRFNTTYLAGNYTVTLRVTDNGGLISEESINVELYDSSPPLVIEKIHEISVSSGTPYEFIADATDSESINLQYSWDFDIDSDGIDEDGDTSNDVDATGNPVSFTFENSGSFEVVCTITNDAGIPSQITYFVSVKDSTNDNSIFGMNPYLLVGLIILIVIFIVALVGLISWRRMTNERLKLLLAEQEAADEEKPRELTIEEQKAMYGGNSAFNQPAPTPSASSFGQFASGMSGSPNPVDSISIDDAIDEVDIEALINSPTPIESTKVSSPAADLLAQFSTDEDEVVEDDVVEFSHNSDNHDSEEMWNSDVSEFEEEELPVPPPPTIDEPEDDNLEEDKNLDKEAEDSSELQDDRTVQQDCSDCEQRFEIILPEGHDVVRAACPSCGSIQTVKLE